MLLCLLLLAAYPPAAGAQPLGDRARQVAAGKGDAASTPRRSAAGGKEEGPRPAPSPAPPAATPAPQPPEPPFKAFPDMLADDCYRDAAHDRADLCAQWRAALAAERAAKNSATANWLAGLSVLVGIVGFVALIRNLKLMRETNRLSREANRAAEKAREDNREIGEAQARCYLALEDVRAHVGDDGRPRLAVVLRNSGASPALDLRLAATLCYTQGEPPAARRGTRSEVDGIKVSIAPGATMNLPHFEIDFPISAHERARLLTGSGELLLDVELEVSATDVFKKPVSVTCAAQGVIADLDTWSELAVTGSV
jgi:hypothetical protein